MECRKSFKYYTVYRYLLVESNKLSIKSGGFENAWEK